MFSSWILPIIVLKTRVWQSSGVSSCYRCCRTSIAVGTVNCIILWYQFMILHLEMLIFLPLDSTAHQPFTTSSVSVTEEPSIYVPIIGTCRKQPRLFNLDWIVNVIRTEQNNATRREACIIYYGHTYVDVNTCLCLSSCKEQMINTRIHLYLFVYLCICKYIPSPTQTNKQTNNHR